MDDIIRMLGLSSLFRVNFGVPGNDHWPLFVLSKWALIILPLYAVRYFGASAHWLENHGIGKLIPGFGNLRIVLEKFIAHTMFYIGMGIPIIGLNAVLDLPRLLGFTLTSMLIHEVFPRYLSQDRFQSLWSEWRRTLGLNLVVDDVVLEMTVFADRKGNPIVCESPHSRIHGFIQATELFRTENGPSLKVSLRRFFVPKGKDRTFFVHGRGDAARPSSGTIFGSQFRFELRALADFALPVYVNERGWRRWLWRPQYWTKFFYEAAGRSYMTTPFQIIRKFVLVVLGTPLAFGVGNMFAHFEYGQTLNWHPLLYFNYGLIFAFTIGGMYGASFFSTLTEILVCTGRHLIHKRNVVVSYFFRRANGERFSRRRNFNPYFRFDAFGALLEREYALYRNFRLLFGGVFMGGLCAWGLTYLEGESWNEFWLRNAQLPLIELLYATDVESSYRGVHGEYRYGAVVREYYDGNNQLFLLHPLFTVAD